MRRHFYVIPTGTLAANPPRDASWHAMPCPGDPTLSMVVVAGWYNHTDQDAWEALPGVVEHLPEDMGGPAFGRYVAALAPWGARAGMTLRELHRTIRSQWPCWRD